MKRKGITPKTRFEVFKRDKFTCQYCGKSAPDIILHIDHIDPVFNGGHNDILNLITSCKDCNLGKSKNLLSDNSVIVKQQKQLEELQERREQIELMLQWRESLLSIDDEIVEKVNKKIISLTGFGVSKDGKKLINSWVKKFGIMDLFDSVEISFNQYYGDESNFSNFFYSIPKIANMRIVQKEKPYLADLFRIRAGLSYKMRWLDKRQAMDVLTVSYLFSIEHKQKTHEETIMLFKKIANRNNDFSDWLADMEVNT